MVVPGTFRNNINRNECVLYEFRSSSCCSMHKVATNHRLFLGGFYSLESESKRENRGSSDIYRLQVDFE